ncbi:MAG: alpha-ketoglutarate-dependent dioxygenase AlkB [Isosphaeraceae bacterium]
MLAAFECHDLDGRHSFHTGHLPEGLLLDAARFEELWSLHPEEYHVIQMHGRPVRTPRWQQAYGRDYHYTGHVNAALPMLAELEPLVAWAREAIDARLNGALLNWYDGELDHYIGPHHDSTKGLVVGSPIVTVSLGQERTFRLTQPKTKDRRDFSAVDGAVFVTPWETNKTWKHQVLKSARLKGRRISVTLRAFAG